MKITTLRFGDLDLPDDKIIQMAKPVLGFEQLKKFCIIEGEDFEPFLWFQSVEEPSVACITYQHQNQAGQTTDFGKFKI